MKIGELSKKTGLSAETIRYYEAIKLIPKPKTTEYGYRKYTEEFVNTLHLVIQLKKSSFTLKEIKSILISPKCKNVNHAVKNKIRSLDRQIKESTKIKNNLEKLLAVCPNKGNVSECTILQTLNKRK